MLKSSHGKTYIFKSYNFLLIVIEHVVCSYLAIFSPIQYSIKLNLQCFDTSNVFTGNFTDCLTINIPDLAMPYPGQARCFEVLVNFSQKDSKKLTSDIVVNMKFVKNFIINTQTVSFGCSIYFFRYCILGKHYRSTHNQIVSRNCIDKLLLSITNKEQLAKSNCITSHNSTP